VVWRRKENEGRRNDVVRLDTYIRRRKGESPNIKGVKEGQKSIRAHIGDCVIHGEVGRREKTRPSTSFPPRSFIRSGRWQKEDNREEPGPKEKKKKRPF